MRNLLGMATLRELSCVSLLAEQTPCGSDRTMVVLVISN
jgi:hypothetical protein